MRKKVSAAIVTYKGYEKAHKAVETIIDYTKGVDLDFYIVDNASKDGTASRLKSAFPSLTVIEKNKNDGFARGHNEVLSLIDSDYHAVINPDIIIDRDVLTELSDFLDANTNVGLVTPKILNPDGTDQHLPKRDPTVAALIGRRMFKNRLKDEVSYYRMDDIDLTESRDIEFATGCFFLIRTSLYKKLGGFDTRFFMYYEDMDITRRARQLSRTVYYPYTQVCHLWERSSAHKLKFFLILVTGMFKYFNKWGWRFFYTEKNDSHR